jgi:predicted Fe-Mo cluster-binding NifX family protein
MKIAIPTKEALVDQHFGHCEYFTIIEVDLTTQSIISTSTLDAPQSCGCKSDIAHQLATDQIEYLLAGNMGSGALNKLNHAGIKVIRGCQGSILTVVNAWLQGQLIDNDLGCQSHDHGHTCHH